MNMFTESTPCSCGFLPRSSKSERLSSELMQCAKVIVDNWKSPVAINSSLDT
ncbi:10630_t:CDS:2 [Entrophospora sp. SA101]|nr:5774_t:CDS:2 [Entrophospora sp. SA101]CAJ0912675.1 10630_t:CDS:2 [Entrophospora sp. SA101]